MKTKICTGLFFILFSISCHKNEKAVILLSPFDLYMSAKTSEVVVIDINCHSPVDLKQLVIKSRTEGGFAQTELDTTISGKDFYLQFEYLVPELIDNPSITLEFDLFDITNQKVSNFKILTIESSAVYLTEIGHGLILYSKFSGNQNACNLLTGTMLYQHLYDSSILHIADTSNNETLLNRWVSPAGLKFVKFNDFDYAKCTNISAKAAFNGGAAKELINNLSVGDIYITKIRTHDLKDVYPVIQIVDIFDMAGSESDRYVFNLKK